MIPFSIQNYYLSYSIPMLPTMSLKNRHHIFTIEILYYLSEIFVESKC